MDSLSDDLLDNIVEHLDTINCRLEKQNQEQAVLSEKLSEVSTQLEQEKVFMRDQLQDAQNEILRRLMELQTKGEEPRNLHGSLGQGVEPSGNTDYEGIVIQDHVLDTFGDAIVDEVTRSVQDVIRNEFERRSKHVKDSFDETQQNIADFTERTKVDLFIQTAAMNNKVDHIDTSNKDLKRKMSTCEKNLTRVENTKQHVKAGALNAMNELKSSAVRKLEPLCTNKTMLCLLLFYTVGLAVWYRSEGLARNEEFLYRLEVIQNHYLSTTNTGIHKIRNELRNIADMACKMEEDIKAKFASMTKKVIKQIEQNHILRCLSVSEDTQNTSRDVVRSDIMLKSMLQSLDRKAEHMLKIILNGTDKSTSQQEGASLNFKGTANNTSLYLDVTINAILKHVENHMLFFCVPIWLLCMAALFVLFTSTTRKKITQEVKIIANQTKCEILSVTGKIKSEIISVTEKTNNESLSATNKAKNEIISNTDKAKSEIISNTDMAKSEIISVTDQTKFDTSFTGKENQISSDRTAEPLPLQKTYIFDFYVENFQHLIRSGARVTSLPWHIYQFDTSVSGRVLFLSSGEMVVKLTTGRHPRKVGLESKLNGSLKLKATITDTSGELPDHVVGKKTLLINEEYIKDNYYWGLKVGVVSCDELMRRGYGQKEGYVNGALLIRYEITVE